MERNPSLAAYRLLYLSAFVRTGDPLWSPLARRPELTGPNLMLGSITVVVDLRIDVSPRRVETYEGNQSYRRSLVVAAGLQARTHLLPTDLNPQPPTLNHLPSTLSHLPPC